ncbi:DUF945 family protein [Corallincola platygyrae]|uniref:DUF945 family protein n=1 Tax=Corallincola platygyrae TaxID=1193278 RepID=A0ABW4XL88_9GAMM
MLKKVLVSLTILSVSALLLALGATFIHGQFYLNQQQWQVDRLAIQEHVEVALTEREYGLFSSKLTYRITLDADQDSPVTFVLINQASYFPHQIRILSQLAVPSIWAEQFESPVMPMQLLSHMDVMGNFHGEFTMDSWLVEDGVAGLVQVQPALGTVAGNLEAFDLNFNWDGFAANGMLGEMKLQGLRIAAELRAIAPELYVGDSEWSIGGLDSSDSNNQFSLRDFKVSNVMTENGSNLSHGISLGWESITTQLGAAQYHSAQSLMKLNISGIDKTSWLALQTLAQDEQATESEVEAQLLAMLQNGMAVDVPELKLNLQDANASGELQFSLARNDLNELAQVQSLLAKVNGKANLAVDYRLVQMLPMPIEQVNQMVAVGYLTFDENSEQYRADLSVTEGQLTLNGQPLPM